MALEIARDEVAGAIGDEGGFFKGDCPGSGAGGEAGRLVGDA